MSIFSATNAIKVLTSSHSVTETLLSPAITGKYMIDVKGKKTKGGGTTRNVAGSPAGCKWGLKVYDGQRVPQGTTLLTQSTMKTMPGWNVGVERMNKSLVAARPGRVMMTTELMDPDLSNKNVAAVLPRALKPEQKIFKQYVHIIPDRSHQIFKLVEQI